MFQSLLVAGALAGSLASALPSFGSLPEPNLFPRASCSGNTASTRSEWCDYSVDTDYGTETPDTGVTREYWLELTDVTVAPDGVSRSAMAVNGSIPGPTLFADWGDTVKVHVTNSLTTSNNGTSIHFHGIRQNYTNQNDGVSSITQCPTAPGDTITYTWKATQYGSTWYHSHFALQAWQGIFGGIVINGPATANYDEDLGMLFLNDWDHQTVDELYSSAETSGPPTLDNGLINGTNVYGDDDSTSQTGYRYNVTWDSGTSYRMRLVNAAVDTHWKFSIDNHTMQVIASDLVPITPYNATVLDIGMGQRYDIIVTADQASTADNFWIRAIPQSACSDNDSTDNIKGIISYTGTITTPTTTGYSYTDSCDDETDNLAPYVSKTVSDANWDELESATVGKNTAGLFKWSLNSTSMLVDWANPTLESIVNGTTSWETDDAVIELSEANQWVYFVVETTLGVPHPIHLHGHDFFVLAQGSGTYSSSITLNTSNPPRRDTAMLPASGYLVMAWETDNPGAWLMHCHIGWHTSEGFSMQFIERYSEIAAITDNTTLTDTCSTWTTFQEENEIEQEDSGV
ncbi:multicopper oxidase [Colletotrichum tofieldiae]|uniref:laccase n=1 Tax=Colletotrichum tofieldiae TaxID=708197 RepID=A0A166XDE9_9PEZI|nr:multicopper oxidase [Colletotrichum tofieldiae]GKT66437.1 multicopper oxidase [Colletotrichum tofieldiae]GKT71505.1 multicopper oxidase [Colletotrichum tofieldiae]